MAEFLRPSKRSLTNAQHFEFIDAFITVLVEANFTAAKIVALLNSLRNVFSEEDRYAKQIKKDRERFGGVL